ncbi:MAG TPA: hypothetical protein VHO90_14705 [Bacteroidales bacterium]|nr:hypothetical protein [Bacteroidales bacterium]
MKMLFLSIGLLWCVSIANGCKDQSIEPKVSNTFNLDTLTFDHSMKGWELYSWTQNNTWNFSILVGTNRNKTYTEVIENDFKVKGVDSLKLLLAKLPAKEEIFWMENVEGQRMVLPNEQTIDEIKTFCEQKQLLLHVAN